MKESDSAETESSSPSRCVLVRLAMNYHQAHFPITWFASWRGYCTIHYKRWISYRIWCVRLFPLRCSEGIRSDIRPHRAKDCAIKCRGKDQGRSMREERDKDRDDWNRIREEVANKLLEREGERKRQNDMWGKDSSTYVNSVSLARVRHSWI